MNSANRLVLSLFTTLMTSDEIETTYASQFSPTTGAPAKPARLAFGALFIKQRLGLTDVETVEQIREKPCIQFFLGFAGYSNKTPFDPSMMVHFRKRFSEEDLTCSSHRSWQSKSCLRIQCENQYFREEWLCLPAQNQLEDLQ